MSFDSTFDYTPVVKGLTAERDHLASTVAALQKEKVLLEGATAYADSPEVGNRIIQLSIEIDRESKILDAANEVLAEIAEVVALPEAKKTDLYYFYSIVETSKQDFMSKVLFNHHAALNDEKIAALRADTTTDPSAKVLIAKLLYNNYVMIPNKITALMAVFRYVR